jgi:putative glutamine amidotransferase
MSRRTPRVGLTTYFKEAAWGDWLRVAALTPATYVEAVVRCGGTPLLLPPVGTDTSVLEALDALVVIGGSDLEPGRYGQEPHPTTRPEPWRDDHDLALVHAALASGTPLLAICRGVQVLNVALGGTLHQHVPDVVPGVAREVGGATVYQPAPGRYGEVEVMTEPGSRIAEALGPRTTVPCYHHQAVDRVADGLRVTARSADGLVQALEPEGPAWALGVQFHPEEDPTDDRLFAALLQHAHHQEDSRR